MDILKKLKKKKEEDSPFSGLIKKTPKKEEVEKDEDIEVKPLHVDEQAPPSTAPSPPPRKEEPVFHATGMRELDFDTVSSQTEELSRLKGDYIKKISDLIHQDRIGEAINLLEELKGKIEKE